MQGASVAPLLSPLLLHLWAPLLTAHLSLLLLLWSVYCYTFWAFSFCYTFGFSLLLLLWSVYCYSFEVFTATPLKCLLLHLWAFSSATPLGFLFCYSFGISLLLNLPVSKENWRKMKHVIFFTISCTRVRVMRVGSNTFGNSWASAGPYTANFFPIKSIGKPCVAKGPCNMHINVTEIVT